MPSGNPGIARKESCVKGHILNLVGRTVSGGCKRCAYLRRYDWRNNHPEKFVAYRRKSDLKAKYNLTIEQYKAMLQKQNGLCAMCNLKKKLVIDHCHKTNKVRGLLCIGCNIAVGHYENHKEQIEKYLGDLH